MQEKKSTLVVGIFCLFLTFVDIITTLACGYRGNQREEGGGGRKLSVDTESFDIIFICMIEHICQTI